MDVKVISDDNTGMPFGRSAAERITVMLNNMIRRYEAKNGAIDSSAQEAASDKSPKLQ